MQPSLAHAVELLYQAPLDRFVAERKRLTEALKATGDKEAAQSLGHCRRPAVSVWIVNQLWWQERASFEAFFATAQRLREGDLSATSEHRASTSKLQMAALRLLQQSGNRAPQAMLRRVSTTLAALAATGSFQPDVAGALQSDRDPPGFESLTFAYAAEPTVKSDAADSRTGSQRPDEQAHRLTKSTRAEVEAKRAQVEAEAKRAQVEAEAKRAQVEVEAKRAQVEVEAKRAQVEAEAKRGQAEVEAKKQAQAEAKKQAERERLMQALRAADDAMNASQRAVEEARAALQHHERQLEQATAQLEELQARLAQLT
jgi:colicin import membrane protein